MLAFQDMFMMTTYSTRRKETAYRWRPLTIPETVGNGVLGMCSCSAYLNQSRVSIVVLFGSHPYVLGFEYIVFNI